MERLTVPGTLDSLESIRKYVRTAANTAALDPKAAWRLCQAVDEIAANSVEHGYVEAGREGDLDIWAEIDPDCLRILLEDSGGAFDPHQAAESRNRGKRVEDWDLGGWGVEMAIRNVHAFHYERVGEKNRNIFVMHRAAPAAGAVSQG